MFAAQKYQWEPVAIVFLVSSSFAFPLLWNGNVLEKLWGKTVIVEVQWCLWQQISVIVMPGFMHEIFAYKGRIENYQIYLKHQDWIQLHWD